MDLLRARTLQQLQAVCCLFLFERACVETAAAGVQRCCECQGACEATRRALLDRGCVFAEQSAA